MPAVALLKRAHWVALAAASTAVGCAPAVQEPTAQTIPPPPVQTAVSAVQVSAASTVVAAGFACPLAAAVQGTGGFSHSVGWDIDMGPGTLTAVTETSVIYNAPAEVTDETSVTVSATSLEDATEAAAVSLALVPAAECLSPQDAGACIAKYGNVINGLCTECNSGKIACPHFVCACGMCVVETCPDGQLFGPPSRCTLSSGAADDVRATVPLARASVQHRDATAAAQRRVSAVHFHVVAAAAIREVHHAQHRGAGRAPKSREARDREQQQQQKPVRDAPVHRQESAP
jgi:hypothetical protein